MPNILSAFIDELELTNISLVLHDWGWRLGNRLCRRKTPKRIKKDRLMEAVVKPANWSDAGLVERFIFRQFRGEKSGDRLNIERNYFIEKALPMFAGRSFSEAERSAYRAPYIKPEDRRPVAQWAREIPIDGQPADNHKRIGANYQWLKNSSVPLLLLQATPGAILKQPIVDQIKRDIPACECSIHRPWFALYSRNNSKRHWQNHFKLGFGFGFSSNRPTAELSKFGIRMKRTLQNHIESAAYCVPALAVAIAAGIEGDDVSLAAFLMVAGRGAYALLYYTGIPFIRCSCLGSCKKQDVRALKALHQKDLAHGVNAKFSNGDTPLMYAAKKGDLALFDLLVKAGADPNTRARNGRDILNIAVRTSNPDLARRALKAGTDPKAFTLRYKGSTLIFAADRGEVEIVKMLIAAGAPLDRVNSLGWTALLEATVLGDGGTAHQEIVKALLDAGANRDIGDRDGITPLEHAQKRGHTDMAKILMASLKLAAPKTVVGSKILNATTALNRIS
ncbi:Haloalkane dehalogenase [Nymphon striatum]|nr:Haloalkane dehalogenase [Nymphon striatum]